VADRPQMMDGLALGEPRRAADHVVTWVGYLRRRRQGGVRQPIAAGSGRRGRGDFFTFLPSFLFILVGGPLIEAPRRTPLTPRSPASPRQWSA